MSASDGANFAAQLTGAGNQQAQVSKTETSKDVQNERRQTFKRRHGFLVGFFGLILYATRSWMAVVVSYTYGDAGCSTFWAFSSSSAASS